MWWREPGQLFPHVLEALDEGVMVIDRQGIIRLFNRAAAQLTGCPPEEAVGRPCAEVCRLALCVHCPIEQISGGEELPVKDHQTTMSHPQGERIVRVHTVLLRDEEGEVFGAMEILRDVTHLEELQSQVGERHRFMGLVGRSKAMQDIYHLVELVAPSSGTVLIQGETGTGKELIAEAIHYASPRATRPLVKVNCSALPEPLLETELFGHVRGAFTNAVSDKPGRFELADGGTLFLDEVGDLSPNIQLKLLRALERKEFERIGGVRTLRVDVRVIAATNRNLRELVEQGKFREDLYYRLNVVPIYVPPLRERKEDIPLLVEHFLQQLRERMNKPIQGVEESAMRVLLDYHWPGNIRELQNVLEYAVVVCQGEWIRVGDLPHHLRYPPHTPPSTERERILQALERHHWRIKRTAEALGIDRTTLWRKMKRYGIQRE